MFEQLVSKLPVGIGIVDERLGHRPQGRHHLLRKLRRDAGVLHGLREEAQPQRRVARSDAHVPVA